MDMVQRLAPKPIHSIASLSPLYNELDSQHLTRTQYRHLRKGIELLTANGIVHGDLPDDVMLSNEGFPVIIDFE